MSSSSSAPRGVLLAGLGALASLASLWLPWYTIKLPESFRDALGSIGSGAQPGAGTGAANGPDALAGAFAGLFKGLAAVMPEEVTANGWTAMSGGDVGLAVAAALVVLLVIVAGGASSGVRVDRSMMGRLMSLAGLVVAGIALYHVVSKPGAGAGAFSANVTVKPGLWLALLGGALMIAGGLMTARTPAAPKAEPEIAPQGAHGEGAQFAPPVDGAPTMAAHDPFAAPALDPFAVPTPAPAAAHDPFASPEPYATPAASMDAEPYAAPEPYAPAPEPYATPEPYAPQHAEPGPYAEPVASAPAYAEPEPYAPPAPYTEPEPYAAPAAAEPFTAYAAPDPAPEPDPYAPEPVHDPYAPAPVEAAADETPVPDWSGFRQEPEPVVEPEPVHAMRSPSEPRPAGVSIPPPGWTGAA